MKLKGDYNIQKIADLYCAIPLYSEKENNTHLIRMNQIGYEIFLMLREDISIEQIVDEFKKNYDVDSSIIEFEVLKFIDMLKTKDLLV